MVFQLDQLIVPKETFQSMLDFLPYPFLISEFRNGVFTNMYLNQKFDDEIGYTLKEIPTIEDWFNVAYPDTAYRDKIIFDWGHEAIESKRKGLNYILLKARIQTKKSGRQWYEVKSSTFGRFQLVAFVNINDVLSRKEELEWKRENQSKMLSILGHDLRQPLLNLLSITQMASTAEINQQEFMKLVEKVNKKTLQVVEFLETTLQWTKLNFDKINVRHEVIDLEQALPAVMQNFYDSCEAKKIKLTLTIEEKKLTATTDPEILAIVIRNLISNAIKFTPNGGTILVRSWRSGNVVYVSVKDSGIGMSQDRIEKVLSDEYTSQTGTQQEKGLGIGLKLCRDILRKASGKLEIESKPGQGTQMTVSFSV